jgi:hypothetical protein
VTSLGAQVSAVVSSLRGQLVAKAHEYFHRDLTSRIWAATSLVGSFPCDPNDRSPFSLVTSLCGRMGRRKHGKSLLKIIYTDPDGAHRDYELDANARITSGLLDLPRRRGRARTQLKASAPPPSTTVPAAPPDHTLFTQSGIDGLLEMMSDWFAEFAVGDNGQPWD